MLNIVADSGSRMPSAEAVPAGISLSASVYKKYGTTQVHKPIPRIKKMIGTGAFAVNSINSTGLQNAIDKTPITKKQYNVAETELEPLSMEYFVKIL